jgi:flagellar hook-basal body complex protein FliE
MDGLTVRGGQSLINTGKTTSETRASENAPLQPSSSGASTSGAKSFADTLKDSIGQVNQLQKDADVKMQQLATGKTDNIQDVMIAAEKADIGLRLMMQVRNKLVDAYSEVMKMQV